MLGVDGTCISLCIYEPIHTFHSVRQGWRNANIRSMKLIRYCEKGNSKGNEIVYTAHVAIRHGRAASLTYRS